MRIDINILNDDGLPEAEFSQMRKMALITLLVGMCKTDGLTMDETAIFTAVAIPTIWRNETLQAERVDGPGNATQH